MPKIRSLMNPVFITSGRKELLSEVGWPPRDIEVNTVSSFVLNTNILTLRYRVKAFCFTPSLHTKQRPFRARWWTRNDGPKHRTWHMICSLKSFVCLPGGQRFGYADNLDRITTHMLDENLLQAKQRVVLIGILVSKKVDSCSLVTVVVLS
jgi:hypothetical protein